MFNILSIKLKMYCEYKLTQFLFCIFLTFFSNSLFPIFIFEIPRTQVHNLPPYINDPIYDVSYHIPLHFIYQYTYVHVFNKRLRLVPPHHQFIKIAKHDFQR